MRWCIALVAWLLVSCVWACWLECKAGRATMMIKCYVQSIGLVRVS